MPDLWPYNRNQRVMGSEQAYQLPAQGQHWAWGTGEADPHVRVCGIALCTLLLLTQSFHSELFCMRTLTACSTMSRLLAWGFMFLTNKFTIKRWWYTKGYGDTVFMHNVVPMWRQIHNNMIANTSKIRLAQLDSSGRLPQSYDTRLPPRAPQRPPPPYTRGPF